MFITCLKYKYWIAAPFLAVLSLDVYNGITNQHDLSAKAHKLCVKEVSKYSHVNEENFSSYLADETDIKNLPEQVYYVRSKYILHLASGR